MRDGVPGRTLGPDLNCLVRPATRPGPSRLRSRWRALKSGRTKSAQRKSAAEAIAKRAPRRRGTIRASRPLSGVVIRRYLDDALDGIREARSAIIVAALVVNWRRWDLTIDAVESLLRAETAACEPSLRLCIYVLDNESDGPLRPQWPDNVTLLTSPKNLGYGGGNNLLASRALRDYPQLDALFVLNNDATVEPAALSRLIEAMMSSPEVGVVGPLLVLPDGSLESCGGHFGLTRAWWTQFRPEHRVDFVSGAALLVRRQAWEAVGGFDERYFHYAEDIDFAIKVGQHGWRSIVAPDARVVHQKSQAPTTEWRLAYYKIRNLILFARQHRRLRLLGCNSIVNALRVLVPVRHLLRGQFAEARWAWHGLCDGVRGVTGPLLPKNPRA